MSPPPLWLTLEPCFGYTQLVLSRGGVGTMLKARLGSAPQHPGALASLLEAISAWHGAPLYVVLDADADEVHRSPEQWARMMGEAAQCPSITVEWSCPPPGRLWKDPFFRNMGGDYSSAKRLLSHTVLGQR